uniref:Uncharacterized protein n=1 Tax=Timema monikensis TaxID=170555 RepID=A0A7R9E5M3_9NEOP|nr:unnamed protein product [Timema monikensis]
MGGLSEPVKHPEETDSLIILFERALLLVHLTHFGSHSLEVGVKLVSVKNLFSLGQTKLFLSILCSCGHSDDIFYHPDTTAHSQLLASDQHISAQYSHVLCHSESESARALIRANLCFLSSSADSSEGSKVALLGGDWAAPRVLRPPLPNTNNTIIPHFLWIPRVVKDLPRMTSLGTSRRFLRVQFCGPALYRGEERALKED